MVGPGRRPPRAAVDAARSGIADAKFKRKIRHAMHDPHNLSQLRNRPDGAEVIHFCLSYFNGSEVQRFARVTICVGLTKRSAISSQTSVVTI
jgi:hypothetical protein